MFGIFRLVFKELLVFVVIFSGWLLYALLSDLWYKPIMLPAEVVFVKMFYISLQTYFVVAMIRLTHRMVNRGGKDEDE